MILSSAINIFKLSRYDDTGLVSVTGPSQVPDDKIHVFTKVPYNLEGTCYVCGQKKG